jgi:hypothetical protein
MKKVGSGTFDPENVKAQLRADFEYLRALESDNPGIRMQEIENWRAIAAVLKPETSPSETA